MPLNMGVEIREQRAVTRYLLWGSLVVANAAHGLGHGLIGAAVAAGSQWR